MTSDRKTLEFELRGKTLQIYIHFIKHKGEPMGLSEVQKVLGLSSSSIALHHLEKLVSLGVLSRDEYGRFVLVRKVDIAVLQAFASIGRIILPRLGFYAGFFSIIAGAYVLGNASNLNPYALLGTAGSSVVFFYEAWRAWRRKPF
ncbi:MAG TPA: winged helix DNA-binding protein [Nitrososphaerales archaeon]|nr:winged helix DNA-binding protein [Nitrososphaerales archaeon]